MPLPRALVAQHPVDDGDDVGEALPRAGARGHHVVVAAGGGLDGLALVAVQSERAGPVSSGSVFARKKRSHSGCSSPARTSR